MGRMFPWLTYRYVRYDDDGGAGEIAVHTLEVELSEIGKAALLLDEFHDNGPIEPDVPTTPPVSQRWIDGIDDNGDLG